MRMHPGFAAPIAVLALGGSLALGLGTLHQPAAMPACTNPGAPVDGQCYWVNPNTGELYINPTPQEVQSVS